MITVITNNSNIPIALQIENVLCRNDGDMCIADIFLNLTSQITVDPSWRIVDIGADQGGFSLLSANLLPRNTVFAFEPNPKSYHNLVNNLQTFGTKYESILVYPFAISSKEGSIYLSDNEGCSNSRGSSGTEVITKRLENVLSKDSNIFLMKIDTEGHDLEVLESTRKFIDSNKLQNIIFEYTAYWIGSSEEEAITKSKPMLQYLASKYKLYALSRNGPTYLVGPIDESNMDMFIIDHYRRHLQTDIFATNAELKMKIFTFEPNKYLA